MDVIHTVECLELQQFGTSIATQYFYIYIYMSFQWLLLFSVSSLFLWNLECMQIWVYGNSFESFLVGVAIPDQKALEDWAAADQETGDFASLCKNTKARNYILDELNKTGRRFEVWIYLSIYLYIYTNERESVLKSCIWITKNASDMQVFGRQMVMYSSVFGPIKNWKLHYPNSFGAGKSGKQCSYWFPISL